MKPYSQYVLRLQFAYQREANPTGVPCPFSASALSPALLYKLVCAVIGKEPLSYTFKVAAHALCATSDDYTGFPISAAHLPQPAPPHVGESTAHIPYLPALNIPEETPRTRQCCRLVVYVDRPDWLLYCRAPSPAPLSASLGGISLIRVDKTMLFNHRWIHAYAESTLLPVHHADRVAASTIETLPRIARREGRIDWGSYVIVRAKTPFVGQAWVDPDAPAWDHRRRGVFFLDFHN